MTWQAWLTLAVLASFVVMRNKLAPAAASLVAIVVLLVTGVISTEEALAGFANPAAMTVAALYVLARVLQSTAVLDDAIARIVGAGAERLQLVRLVVASALSSAFLNNTPLVAMLVPPITNWADGRRRSPSTFLLPMTYAVSLGGTLTLVGTSTNLVASGIAHAAGEAPIGMFELSRLGVPVAIAGLVALVIAAPFAIRKRRAPREQLQEDARDFFVAMCVEAGGPLDGKTVQAAGLRRLEGVFLVALDRRTTQMAPVSPNTVLEGGDELTFVGKADEIVDLQSIRGLASSEHTHIKRFDPKIHTFFEAVIGPGSPLVGKTLKTSGFRARYQAAVVAIHRKGERIRTKLGEVVLRPADTLLFIADPGFRRNDFLLVTRIGSAPRTRHPHGKWIVLLLVLVIGLVATGVLPLLHASLLAAIACIALGLVPPSEVRDMIDLDVIVVVATSFALGTAVTKSGLSDVGGALVGRAADLWGARAALVAITLVTIVLVQFLTCNAAAAVALPVALAVAHGLGVRPRALIMAVTIAASTTYLTPLGYQTKMMVYGPGGYRFGDYTRLGAPVTIAVVATIAIAAPLLWPF